MTNDPKDRHVLAAAVRASAEVIVTFNLRDFPDSAVKPYDVAAVHPDDFLLDQLDLYPRLTIEALRLEAASYRREPTTVRGVLVRLDGLAYRDSPPSPQGSRQVLLASNVLPGVGAVLMLLGRWRRDPGCSPG